MVRLAVPAVGADQQDVQRGLPGRVRRRLLQPGRLADGRGASADVVVQVLVVQISGAGRRRVSAPRAPIAVQRSTLRRRGARPPSAVAAAVGRPAVAGHRASPSGGVRPASPAAGSAPPPCGLSSRPSSLCAGPRVDAPVPAHTALPHAPTPPSLVLRQAAPRGGAGLPAQITWRRRSCRPLRPSGPRPAPSTERSMGVPGALEVRAEGQGHRGQPLASCASARLQRASRAGPCMSASRRAWSAWFGRVVEAWSSPASPGRCRRWSELEHALVVLQPVHGVLGGADRAAAVVDVDPDRRRRRPWGP